MRIKQNTEDPPLFAFEFWKMLLAKSRQYLNVAAYVWVTTKGSKKVQKKERKKCFGGLPVSYISGVWCSSRSKNSGGKGWIPQCWSERNTCHIVTVRDAKLPQVHSFSLHLSQQVNFKLFSGVSYSRYWMRSDTHMSKFHPFLSSFIEQLLWAQILCPLIGLVFERAPLWRLGKCISPYTISQYQVSEAELLSGPCLRQPDFFLWKWASEMGCSVFWHHFCGY